MIAPDDKLLQPRDETWEVINKATHPLYTVTIEPWWANLWNASTSPVIVGPSKEETR